MNYQERLLKAIPGGAHTYSRGYDQFPSNAPQILSRGKGAYIFDPEGKKYLDYGMGLRSINLGYSEREINAAAIEQINNGNNLTRPSMIELEAAELMIELIDSAEMVKFTKNGSTAVSAAVKLARGYTGRELVARCDEHPFFSFDDWFIGSTNLTRGVTKESIQNTKKFRYNDINSLEKLISLYPGQLACVVLEPATNEEPKNDYLKKVQDLCRKNGIVFILDEMITGFRWHLKGAQYMYGISPDISTFGKAMSNGFAVSCLAGKRDIMQIGSIEFEGTERMFLLSTTHGAEMCGLGAFVATIKFMQRHNVVDHLWDYGREITTMMKRKSLEFGIENYFKVGGFDCSPYFLTFDENGQISAQLRTLFCQEMIKNGVLMPWLAFCYRHGVRELSKTESAIDASFIVFKKAVNEGVEKYLLGPSIKPVFRKYN